MKLPFLVVASFAMLFVNGCGGQRMDTSVFVACEVQNNGGAPTFTVLGSNGNTEFNFTQFAQEIKRLSVGRQLTIGCFNADHSRRWFVNRDGNTVVFVQNSVVTRIEQQNVHTFLSGSGLPPEEKDSILVVWTAYWGP